MTAEFPALAAQNVQLLRAIQDRPATSLKDLCDRSGVSGNNVNRKLNSLLEGGLVVSTGEDSYQVEVTKLAVDALAAIAVFEGGGVIAEGIVRLPLDLIDPNPWQPRTVIDPVEDETRAQSIADHDVLSPILARAMPGGRYQQAFGHGRLRSAKIARDRGLVAPDFGIRAEVRDLTDEQMEDIALVENVQRSDLHWLDEAEAYLRQANRGKSAADIRRLVGEKARSKRSIQEFIQFARELDPDDKRRAFLPEGDAERLSYDQCRFKVGNKKARPALELTPKLACAMVELLDAGEAEDGHLTEVAVRLYQRPVGGPLITLSDRGLIRFRFEGATPIATVLPSEPLAKWLEEIGFHADREACLLKIRAAIIGELSAGALGADGRYITPELSPPEPEPQTADDDAEDDEDIPPFLRRLAGGGGGDAAPAGGQQEAPPAATPAPISISPAHALVVTELAHKLARSGIDRQTGRAVTVRDDYRADPLGQELVFERLVMFMPHGDMNMAALTPKAQDWLDQRETPRDEAGVAQVADEALQWIQAEQGHEPVDVYVTAWLNPAPKAELSEVDKGTVAQNERMMVEAKARLEGASYEESMQVGAAYAGGDAAAQVTRPELQPPADPPPERAALQRLAAAAREAVKLLSTARTRKLSAKDTSAVETLVDQALTEADRLLNPKEGEAHDPQA